MTRDHYTVKEVAEKIPCSVASVKNWIKPNYLRYPIPSVKIGGKRLIPVDQFQEWLYKWQNKIA
jgi:excisionase family DNA binding protein